MRTFKKKDIKKINVDELIDSDGSIIDGDKSHETTSQIKTAPAQTTDKFVQTARQKFRYPYGYTGTPYSHGDRYPIMQEEDENIDEAQLKMEKMVEDIISKKLSNKEIIPKQDISDINKNKIPDLDELSSKFNKKNISSAIETLINGVKRESLSGEEKAIILNYIIENIGTKDIEQNYKVILKSKL